MIWLIGGTSESKDIAQALMAQGIGFVVTVTTPEAGALYATTATVIVAKLDRQGIENFLIFHGIKAIVDASHPFAQVISQEAITVAEQFGIGYLRFERAIVATSAQSFANFAEFFSNGVDYLTDRRVLLTIGCRSLPLFADWHNRSHLFARVLPAPASMTAAREAGFRADRLIGMRPPLGLALEIALLDHWRIETVITKASGIAGGEVTKSQACTLLQILLLVIDRPQLVYPAVTNRLDEVITYCLQII